MRNYKKIGFYVVIVVIAMVAVGMGVRAFSSHIAPVQVIEHWSGDFRQAQPEAEEQLGMRGDFLFPATFHSSVKTGKLTTGGSILNATSSMGGLGTNALTLTAAQVCDNRVIHINQLATSSDAKDWWNLIPASLDVTLPATSTLFVDCLDDDGDTVDFLFFNHAATAASTSQIVAGAGMHLMEDNGGNVEIDGQHGAVITITRIDNLGSASTSRESYGLDAFVEVEEFIEAD